MATVQLLTSCVVFTLLRESQKPGMQSVGDNDTPAPSQARPLFRDMSTLGLATKMAKPLAAAPATAAASSEFRAQFYAPLDRVVGDVLLGYIREHHEEMLVRREGTPSVRRIGSGRK